MSARVDKLWKQLGVLINEYAEAYAADQMKGGGDPIDIPVIEAQLVLSNEKVNAQVQLLRRELE